MKRIFLLVAVVFCSQAAYGNDIWAEARSVIHEATESAAVIATEAKKSHYDTAAATAAKVMAKTMAVDLSRFSGDVPPEEAMEEWSVVYKPIKDIYVVGGWLLPSGSKEAAEKRHRAIRVNKYLEHAVKAASRSGLSTGSVTEREQTINYQRSLGPRTIDELEQWNRDWAGSEHETRSSAPNF